MKVIAILPAYNAAATLAPFLSSFPKHLVSEIILVDDCSVDGTWKLAKRLGGVTVYKTPHNLGYGGNLKYCLGKALAHGADAIIEIHPDGEYGFDGIGPAIRAVKGGAALVLGNRFARDPVAHGMRPMKYLVSRVLTAVENVVLGTRIPDLHQGFRVYTRKLLQGIDFRRNSDDYLFSFEIIVQAAAAGFSIASVPVSVHYTGRKRGASYKASVLYTIGTLRVLYETNHLSRMR